MLGRGLYNRSTAARVVARSGWPLAEDPSAISISELLSDDPGPGELSSEERGCVLGAEDRIGRTGRGDESTLWLHSEYAAACRRSRPRRWKLCSQGALRN